MKRLLFLLIITLVGCSTMNNDYLKKVDSSIRKEITNTEKKSTEDEIDFLCKVEGEVTDNYKKLIEEKGIKVQTVIKNIFTGRGTIEEIKALAKLDFVIAIEKSKEVDLLN